MNHYKDQRDNNQFNPIKQLGALLLLTLTSTCPVFAGQAFTGKIVINGQVYGEDDTNVIKGNGIKGSDKRDVDTFNSIKVQGGIDVNYRHAPHVQLEIIGDQNLLPIIKTRVSNGVLIIDSDQSYQTKLPLIVELTAPNLNAVNLAGAGNINLQGLNEKSLQLTLGGSGNVIAEGNVNVFSVRISGSGNVNAKNLESEQADLNITGSGDINLTVKDSLKASIIGSGDINYFGHPRKVEPHILGSGGVEAGD